MSGNIVFVLGAGFTRAFVPDAPLLTDDYQLEGVVEQFKGFPCAKAILDGVLVNPKRVDIERLMTRLSGMPYDNDAERMELNVLEAKIREALVARLNKAKEKSLDKKGLDGFARFVLSEKASIVTFNYDDIFDQALWEVHKVVSDTPKKPYWHPDGGYGFFCRPSSECVEGSNNFMDQVTTCLLKLHGSVNWRICLGEATPFGPGKLLHHEQWLTKLERVEIDMSEIEAHLEPGPFLVPPVLMKTTLTQHPVFRVIWANAHRKLREASKVVFIGYSLPVTDLAARTLFGETLVGRQVDVQVVDYDPDGKPISLLKETYRTVFKDLHNDRFDFSGAQARIAKEFCLPKEDRLAKSGTA